MGDDHGHTLGLRHGRTPRAARLLRRAATDPRWAAGAAFTRVQAQRWLGLEPPAFSRLADEVLFSGSLEGWRYRQDLALLYLLARDVPGPGVVLEIGSFKGLATTALAHGVRHGGGALPVHTTDPHTGDRQDLEHRQLEVAPSLSAFTAAMEHTGLATDVSWYVSTSDDLRLAWEHGAIRVLFIDGWHAYEQVLRDIDNWVPLLTPDGAVVIDDYANYDEVRQAVEDRRDVLPAAVQRQVGRMFLASAAPLSAATNRFLSIRWG